MKQEHGGAAIQRISVSRVTENAQSDSAPSAASISRSATAALRATPQKS
jgi:hypothetical protein